MQKHYANILSILQSKAQRDTKFKDIISSLFILKTDLPSSLSPQESADFVVLSSNLLISDFGSSNHNLLSGLLTDLLEHLLLSGDAFTLINNILENFRSKFRNVLLPGPKRYILDFFFELLHKPIKFQNRHKEQLVKDCFSVIGGGVESDELDLSALRLLGICLNSYTISPPEAKLIWNGLKRREKFITTDPAFGSEAFKILKQLFLKNCEIGDFVAKEIFSYCENVNLKETDWKRDLG